MVPWDLSTVVIQALVQEGSSWTAFAGKGQKDGSFVIPGVPDGPYVLAMKGCPGLLCNYVFTSARTLAIGRDNPFREGTVFPMSPSTAIDGNMTSPEPFTADDAIFWYCPNTRGNAYGPNLVAGDVSFQGQATWRGGLVDGTKGDVLWGFVYTQQTTPSGGVYSVVTRSASFPNVEQADGAVTAVTGTFQAPAMEGVAIDFRASEFSALHTAVHPEAMESQVILGVGPASMLSAWVGVGGGLGPFLLSLYATGLGSLNLGTVQYGNPFPAAWGEALVAWSLVFPPFANQLGPAGGIVVATTPAKASSGPIRPVVSPVLDPRVNGKSAFVPLSGISTTPTLSWQAPAIGTPAGYAVNVIGLPRIEYVATLVTTETTITLPPCILSPGGRYTFQITAIVSDGDIASYPWRLGSSFAIADAFTSEATP
jgi:hypothetical protein